ncbi:MAG TPA: hypothetical protein VFH73_05780 [Polyangia bacterium]|jgi:hypothetical protein|nr:hypothetical protein [Polyangia bacterium]
MFSSRFYALTGALAMLGSLVGCTSSSEVIPPPPTGSGGNPGSGGGSGGQAGSPAGSGGSVGSGGTGGTSSGGSVGSGGSAGSGIDARDTTGAGGMDAVSQDGPAKPPPDGQMASAGCGMPAGQALSTYVAKNTMSGGVARSYRLYLPAGYAPMRPYPLIVLGHGCTGNGGTPFPIETASKSDAIVVALKSVGSCFEYSPTGADVTYFDTVLAEISASHCVDRNRVFMAGFSSGSWLTHTIGCVRAGTVRGQGNMSGNQVNLTMCKGPIAALFAHDVADDQNSFAGAMVARDRILKSNGCGTTTVPWDYDGNPATPSTCVEYQGCMPGYPVVWCPTMAGAGRPTHNNQVPISTVGLWRFWSQF